MHHMEYFFQISSTKEIKTWIERMERLSFFNTVGDENNIKLAKKILKKRKK